MDTTDWRDGVAASDPDDLSTLQDARSVESRRCNFNNVVPLAGLFWNHLTVIDESP